MVAFEELIARHRDKIYARAFSMMRNEDEATDLSQEAWVKGWQRLKQRSYRGPTPKPACRKREGRKR
jgi:DNA-directed RNA polymerase specialized sigma24 family protein